MCVLCKAGRGPHVSRRSFLSGAMAATAAGALLPFAAPTAAQAAMPEGVGKAGAKTLIKGGHILSMDKSVGDFTGDILLEGSKIVEIAPQIDAARRQPPLAPWNTP